MFNIDFQLNKYDLLINIIRKTHESSSKNLERSDNDLENLINDFEKELKPFFRKYGAKEYSFISLLDDYCKPLPENNEDFEKKLNSINVESDFSFSQEEIQSFVNVVKELSTTEIFDNIYMETLVYRDECKQKFESSNVFVTDYLKKILDVELVNSAEENPITVSIMSPRYNNGSTNLDNGIITWGSTKSKEDMAYDTTFITHEILHAKILPYKWDEWKRENFSSKSQTNNLHCLIQFIADKELHSRFTGENYSSVGSHPQLAESMKQMYPFWLSYLYRNEDNPYDCIVKNMSNNPEYSSTIDGSSKYSPEKIAAFSKVLKDVSPYDFIKLDFSRANEIFKKTSSTQKKKS